MSSLDQILGLPEIPVYGRASLSDEEIKKQHPKLYRIWKKRMKLWKAKDAEFDKMDLDFKEKFWKYYKTQIQVDPHLKFWWEHQWWTLTRKNFNKFKFFYN